MYAAGWLEGYATNEQIGNFQFNVLADQDDKTALRNSYSFLKKVAQRIEN